MDSICIRALTRADLPQLADLINTREEPDPAYAGRRVCFTEWIAFNNPFANGEPTYFVAEVAAKIVAHLGRMPVEFVVNGERCKGYYWHDLFVDPECRRKGMGYFLTMSLYEAAEQQSDSFAGMMGISPLNRQMQNRRGYHQLDVDTYFKVLNPREILHRYLRSRFLVGLLNLPLKGVLSLVDLALCNLSFSSMTIVMLTRFDERVDALSTRLLQKTKISTYKSSRHLNWRYIDRPYNNAKAFAAERNGELLGFVVVFIDSRGDGPPEGAIADIMADPDNPKAISALVRAAVDYCRRQKVHLVKCRLTDQRFAKVLKRFLFYRTRVRPSFRVANYDRAKINKEVLVDPRNWHVTLSESDALMFSPK